MEIWLAAAGSSARLSTIIQILEDDLGAGGAGELLRLKFNLPCKGSEDVSVLTWNKITPAFQEKIFSNLSKLIPEVAGFTEKDLCNLPSHILTDLMSGRKPTLFKCTLPHQLDYYVNRKIVTRNLVSISKLNEVKSASTAAAQDIFIFDGLEPHELSSLSRSEMSGQSSDQLSKITVKWMTLDQPSHYQKICKRTKHPVHLIHFDENKNVFQCVESFRDLSIIRNCAEDIENQDTLEEKQFCEVVLNGTHPVCFFESPGMGKSILLSQIGRMLKVKYPNRIILFFQFSDFIQAYANPEISDTSTIMKIKSVLKKLASDNELGNALLSNFLESCTNNVLIELLLDGFDELPQQHISLGLKTLKRLKSIQSIRVWVTSRPHFLKEVENELLVFGYNLKPFDDKDQVQFLSKFWSREQENSNDNLLLSIPKLQEFAKRCLECLKSNMNSNDHDIAGIPLQCYLLGEIYEEDAKEFARWSGKRPFRFPTQAISITSLYKGLVENRIKKYLRAYGKVTFSLEEVLKLHMKLSLKLLFPQVNFKYHDEEKLNEEDLAEMLKVGIIEANSTINSPQFIHRTFAEYFAARFIFAGGEVLPNLIEFIFASLFECRRASAISYEFTNRVPCYFTNAILKETDEVIALPYSVHYYESSATMQKIASACAVGNFSDLFDFLDRGSAFKQHSSAIFNFQFLLTAIQKSNLDLVRIATSRFKFHHQFTLDKKVQVLQMALRRGEFFILEYIIKEERLHDVIKMWDLQSSSPLHECVTNSHNNSALQLEQKLQILKLLVGINKNLLEAKVEGCSPILCKNIHTMLVLQLVKMGADTLAVDADGDCVLHLNSSREHITPQEFHLLVDSIPEPEVKLRELFTLTGKNGDTPLSRAVQTLNIGMKTLEIFANLGTNFRHANDEGESIIGLIIKNGRNSTLLNNFIQMGHFTMDELRRNYITEEGRSLLHIATSYGNVECANLLLELGLQVNDEKDQNGNTPFHCAMESLKKVNTKDYFNLAKLLLARGGNPDALNNFNESPISLAMSHDGVNLETFRLLKSHSTTEFNSTLTLIAIKFIISKLLYKCRHRKVVTYDYGSGKPTEVEANAKAGKQDESLLHMAAKNQDEKEVIFLIKNGADVNALTANSFQTPLHKAAFKSSSYISYKVLEHLINGEANVSLKDTENYTFLHYLFQDGTTFTSDQLGTLVELLALKRSCSVFNIQGGESNATPLQIALLRFEMNQGMLETLHKNRVNFNAQDKLGRSVLSYAIHGSRNAHLIPFLVASCGADYEALHENDENLLHVAATALSANIKTLEYLLKLGVDINGPTNMGNTPLHYAVMSYESQEGSIISKKTSSKAGRQTIKLLLRNGADVNLKNEHNKTPLSMAMSAGKIQLCFLVQKLSKSYQKDPNEFQENVSLNELNEMLRQDTPFHLDLDPVISFATIIFILKQIGTAKDNLHLAKECLRKLDVNVKDPSSGNTPLHVATEGRIGNENEELQVSVLVKILLDCGAIPNELNNELKSPLHFAVGELRKTFQLDLTKLLVNHGANVFAKDKEGYTFLHALFLGGPDITTKEFHDLAEYLIGKGHAAIFDVASESTEKYYPLQLALIELELEERTLRLLKSSGVNMSLLDGEGKPALFYAIEGNRSIDCISLIVDEEGAAGPNWQVTDNRGNSVLHIAADFIHLEALQYFLQLAKTKCQDQDVEVDINLQNSYGNTPLHLLIFKENHDVSREVQFLIENGARIDVINNTGDTPFTAAMRRDDFALLKPILENKARKLHSSSQIFNQGWTGDRMEVRRLAQLANREYMLPIKLENINGIETNYNNIFICQTLPNFINFILPRTRREEWNGR